MTSNLCAHTILEKTQNENEKNQSVFKCLDCGKLTSMDEHICKLCGDLPVDDINGHMLHVHKFDVNRWKAVTGLGTGELDEHKRVKHQGN